MPATYTPIATTTLGSANNSVTFNSFSGYTDLVLVFTESTSTATSVFLRFNGSTSGYSRTFIAGDGSTASSARATNQDRLYVIGGTTNLNFHKVDIQNYSNSTTFKTVLWNSTSPNSAVYRGVSLWQTTGAITSIEVGCNSGNFNTGSTFTLYGIQNF